MGNTSNVPSGNDSGYSSLCLEGPPDSLVMIANRSYHYYAGNSYLGLQSHPGVLAATCEATLRYGTGTGTTRFALTAPPVLNVEELAAKYLRSENAFYYGSEHLGPQILLETLETTFDRIFIDEAADKGIFQAVKSCALHSRPVVFRHNDPDNLRLELRKHLKPSERPLVLTNGVFATTGKIAPLDRYAMVLSPIDGASLLVDDSHGFGVLGPYGRGVFEHFGLKAGYINRTIQDTDNMFDFDMHTHAQSEMSFDDQTDDFESGFVTDHEYEIANLQQFSNRTNFRSNNHKSQPAYPVKAEPSIMDRLPVRYYHAAAMTKAIGGSGGIIAGSDLFIEHLIERSGAFGNMAAPSSPLAAGTAEGLTTTFRTDELRRKLRKNTHYIKKKLSDMGFSIDSSDVPIIPITLGTAGNMRRMQQRLSERGILIAYIPRGPGLPPDGTLRITIFATHTPEMLDHLAEQFEQVL